MVAPARPKRERMMEMRPSREATVYQRLRPAPDPAPALLPTSPRAPPPPPPSSSLAASPPATSFSSASARMTPPRP
jgi:hypothetical protein